MALNAWLRFFYSVPLSPDYANPISFDKFKGFQATESVCSLHKITKGDVLGEGFCGEGSNFELALAVEQGYLNVNFPFGDLMNPSFTANVMLSDDEHQNNDANPNYCQIHFIYSASFNDSTNPYKIQDAYFFVTGFKYLTKTTASIQLKLDVFTTYGLSHFDKPLMIERKTANRFEKGLHYDSDKEMFLAYLHCIEAVKGDALDGSFKATLPTNVTNGAFPSPVVSGLWLYAYVTQIPKAWDDSTTSTTYNPAYTKIYDDQKDLLMTTSCIVMCAPVTLINVYLTNSAGTVQRYGWSAENLIKLLKTSYTISMRYSIVPPNIDPNSVTKNATTGEYEIRTSVATYWGSSNEMYGAYMPTNALGLKGSYDEFFFEAVNSTSTDWKTGLYVCLPIMYRNSGITIDVPSPKAIPSVQRPTFAFDTALSEVYEPKLYCAPYHFNVFKVYGDSPFDINPFYLNSDSLVVSIVNTPESIVMKAYPQTDYKMALAQIGMTNQESLTIPFNVDKYDAYMESNRNAFQLKNEMSLLNAGIGSLASVAGVFTDGGKVSSYEGMATSLINYTGTKMGIVANIKDLKDAPDAYKGGSSQYSQFMGYIPSAIQCIGYDCNAPQRQQILFFYHKYGYTYGRYTAFVNDGTAQGGAIGHYLYDYLKCSDPELANKIDGSVPYMARKEIADVLNRGTTIWNLCMFTNAQRSQWNLYYLNQNYENWELMFLNWR